MSALVSWLNAVDTAAISTGSEASNLRAFNLADPVLKRVWRSLSATSYCDVLFAAETTVAVLALGNTNIRTGDSVRHRLYDVSGTVILDVTVDANVVAGYNQHTYVLDAPLSALHWRCDITATSRAALGNFDVGRAWAGPAWFTSISPAVGWSEKWNDTSQTKRGVYSGVRSIASGAKYRSVDFTLDWMSDDDRAQAMEFARVIGLGGQCLVIPFSDGDLSRQPIIGGLPTLNAISQPVLTFPATFSQQFTIEQDL